MKSKLLFLAIVLVLATFICGCGPGSRFSVPERKQIIQSMEDETLQKLYREEPEARGKIAKAAGYGVFSSGKVNFFLISGGGGYGVVVNNSNGKRTYMKMALGGVGPGLGAKDYRQILIFNSKDALYKFIYGGWEFGGETDAAAKAGPSGGELSSKGAMGAGISAYSMTESGLALQATVAGSKYWPNADLND
ncbi:MAG: lipid-binding SYLF domain-containing protein [Planctomycetota bacterium]|jgi:lipid-binding SYLF domain-containing protein